MGAKFDSENLLDAIKNVLTNNDAFNNKILEIEAEKTAAGNGLTPTLAPVVADAYFLQSWSDKVLNYNPGIFYGIEDVQTQDGGGGVAKVYKIFVEITLVDNGMTNDISRRISRYARALEELFKEVTAEEIPFNYIRVDTVRPAAFKLALNSDEEIKVGGVSLTIALY